MNHTERAIVSLRILLWLASLLGNSLLLLSLLLLSGGLQTRRAKTAPSSAAGPSRSQRGRTFHLFLANLATANLVGTCLADMPDLVSIAMVEMTRPRDLEGDILTVVCPALKFASAVAETGAICFTLLICVYRYQKLCGWPAFSGGRGGDQGGGRTEEVATEAGGGIGEGRGVGGDGDRAAGGEGMSDIDGGGDGRGGGDAVFEEEADGGVFVGGRMRDVGRGLFGVETEGDRFGGGLVIGGQIIEAASPQHVSSTIQRPLERTNTTTITTTTNIITTTNNNNKNADLSAHKTRDRDSNPALRSAPLDQQRLARLCCLLAWATTVAFSLPSIFMGSEWEAPIILMPYSINSTSSTFTNLTSSSFTNLSSSSSSSTNSSSLSMHRDTCPSDLFTCPKARRCAVSHMAYKYIYLLGTNVCPLVVVFVASLRIVLTLMRSRRAAVKGLSSAEPSSGGGGSVKTRGGSGPVLMALMLFEVSWCAHLALQFLADSDRLIYWSDADFFITGVYTSTSPYIFGIGSGLLPPKSPARATG